MDINTMILFEDGQLDADQVVELFQQLLDTGVLWHLQGSYGRLGVHLLEQGLITRSPNHGARKRAKKRGKKVKAIPQFMGQPV